MVPRYPKERLAFVRYDDGYGPGSLVVRFDCVYSKNNESTMDGSTPFEDSQSHTKVERVPLLAETVPRGLRHLSRGRGLNIPGQAGHPRSFLVHCRLC